MGGGCFGYFGRKFNLCFRKKLVRREAGLIASAILAVMPVAVALSRFSWNPNPTPLVSLVMIWSTWMAYRYAKKYWLLVALTFSILIQLYYVVNFTTLAASLIWFFQLCLAFAELWRFKRWLGAVVMSAFLVYEGYFLVQTRPWQSAGLTLDEIAETAKLIVQNVASDEVYNVVLLDDTGDLDAFKYRYFLNTFSHPPTKRAERDKAKLLFIIDERGDRQTQKATDSPAYEIVVFPDKTPIKRLVGPGGQDIWVLKKD